MVDNFRLVNSCWELLYLDRLLETLLACSGAGKDAVTQGIYRNQGVSTSLVSGMASKKLVR